MLIERLHGEAWAAGADAAELSAVSSYLERLATTGWRVDAARVRDVEARAEALSAPGGA